jgi:hypothetical protein
MEATVTVGSSHLYCAVCVGVCGQYPMWPTVKSSLLVTLKGGGPVSSVGKINMCRQSRKRSSELDPAGSSSPLSCHLYFHAYASLFALAQE